METVRLEFANAGPRFYREARGILWEAHKNVAVTRMENRDTQMTKGSREVQADNDREDWPEREEIQTERFVSV